MNIMKSMIAMSLVALFMGVASVDLCAQTTSAKAGADDKKEVQKEKVVERVVEKSGPSVEQQLRKMFNSKSETSLSAPRLENMGVFFLDKHTGDVTVMGVYKSESVRWRIQRDSVADDVVNEDQLVNYQLIKYGNSESDVVLLNVNTGVMWTLDYKGLILNYKNSRFVYLPMRDTEW